MANFPVKIRINELGKKKSKNYRVVNLIQRRLGVPGREESLRQMM